MTEIFTLFMLSEFSTRIWINDLLFSHPIFLKSTITPNIYLFVLVFGITFFTAQWLIPQAIRFAHRFQLVDHPNLRKKHIVLFIPQLGSGI